MNKILSTIGVLAVGGGLSLCDLCGSGSAPTGSASSTSGLVSIAHAASPATVADAGSASRGQATGRAVTMKTVTLNVAGMTCGGCVYSVRKVLTRLPGVSKADVSYEQSRAVVTYNPAAVTVGKMVAAIKTLGYTATSVAPVSRS